MRTTIALLATAAASAKNVRFCCKTEFPETQLGDPFCGRQDLVFVGHRQEAREWSRDTVLEFLNGVATNLLFLLPLRMLHARRRTADTCACLGLIITSSAYHYCDVFRIKLLGMNAGNWHRLDNIFAIVTPVAVVPLLMGRARTPQHQRDIDFVRSSSLFIGLFFQELNPWNVLCTITPVVLAFLYYVWWWHNRAPKGHAARFRTRPFRLALVASCCAVVCFVKGLDEHNDPARFFHGCWHIANAASASLLLAALDPVEATRLRE